MIMIIENWYISLSKNRAKINVIKSFAKNKKCPQMIKKKVKSINSHELQYKSFIKQRKELNNKVGLYKDLKKEESKLRTKQRAKIRSITIYGKYITRIKHRTFGDTKA